MFGNLLSHYVFIKISQKKKPENLLGLFILFISRITVNYKHPLFTGHDYDSNKTKENFQLQN